jgi:hypothetical protein
MEVDSIRTIPTLIKTVSGNFHSVEKDFALRWKLSGIFSQGERGQGATA